MAKLTELLKNIPKAVGDTAKDRAKSLGKSIVRNVHPKNLLAKGFYALHSAASAELPELGGILGGVGAFAGDVFDRASGKRNKKFGQYSQPQYQQPPQAQRSNDNRSEPASNSIMLKLLESINGSIGLLCSDSKSIIAELKTLTSITAKVWDVNKKTLAATRQGNEIQVDLDRKRKFTTQEAAGDFKGESKFGTSAPEPKKKEPFSFEVTESMFHAAEGLLAEAGEISAGILGIKLAAKAVPKFKKVSRGTASTFGEAEGAKAGSPMAAKAAQGAKLGPAAVGAGEAGEGAAALGAGEGAATEALGASAAAAGAGLLSAATIGYIVVKTLVGAIKGAMKSNLFQNFDKIMDDVSKTYEGGTLVDGVIEFFKDAKIGDLIAKMMIGGGEALNDAGRTIGKLIAHGILYSAQHLFANVLAAMAAIIPDKLGGKWLKDKADEIANKEDWFKSVDAAADRGAKMINGPGDTAPVAAGGVPSNFVPQSETTKQAASIHSNQQMVDQAQTTSQMGAMKPAGSGTNVISSTQNNVNNTANSFAVSGPGKRGGELEEHIYTNISQ